MAKSDTPRDTGSRMKPWLRVVLFASLALNLVTVGVVAGVAWRHLGSDEARAPRGDRVSTAYIRALSDDDKRAIRDGMRAGMPDRQARRAEIRDSFAAILGALRTDSFDRAELDSLLEAQFAIGAGYQARARALMLDRLEGMTSAERRAFADRLEDELRLMAQRGGKRGGPHGHFPHRGGH